MKDLPEDLLHALLDNPYECTIIVDAQGVVRFMSSYNEGVFSIPVKETLGRHISEVSPETHLTRVLETGEAEIGRGMLLNRKKRVVARIPLKKDGQIVGAAGKLMFSSPKKLKELYDQIETLENKINFYKNELNQYYAIRYSFGSIIGRSEPMAKAKDLARQAAESDASVIITGESGTGKELFAHAIHQASARAGQNFVRLNCAAVPSELIEAELFGYEPGAYTGASKKGKAGKFELAHNGTIFLDEIGDMPTVMQVKLMRVLQEKEVERIGGGEPKRINFRVISATNRDIKRLMDKRAFRLDLYYRLNVMHIHLPALREISADIQLIFDHFLRQLARGRRPPEITPEAAEMMRRYPWPGNIRELRNVAERAMIVCKNDRIESADLPFGNQASPSGDRLPGGAVTSLKEMMAEAERQHILHALQASGNNRAMAAKALGIHRTGLYQKMKKHGIT